MTKTKLINGTKFTFGSNIQNNMIKDINNNDFLIKSFLKEGNKIRNGWATINQKKLSDMLSINDYLQEVIYKYPCKLYFDIDGKDKNMINLNKIKDLINKYFFNPKMAISGYENENKSSFHIVLPELLITDYDNLIRMKEMIKYINQQEQYNYFDEAVYTKNRCMKLINQSKIDAPNNIQKIIENSNYYDHIISGFIHPESKPFFFDIDIPNKNLNIAKLPKVDKDLKAKISQIKITPKNIDTNLKLLNLMPIDSDLHHDICWKFANFAFHNGITFDQFWSWCKLKRDSAERRNKYISIWNKFNKDDKIKYTSSYIKKILSVYYPNIHNISDIRTSNFVESFNLQSTKIPILKLKDYETADIKNSHFDVDNKVVIFNIGMGGGKTGATVKYLKNSKKSFILLSVRQTLSRNTSKRLKDQGVDVYDYLSGDKSKKDFNINNSKSLIISTESLYKLQDTSKFDVLVIDEIESLLNNWDSTTHNDRLNDNFYNFKSLFENCKKVILLDAFITTKTINFLESLNIKDYIIYTSDYQKQPRKLIEYNNPNEMISNIITDLDNNKKLFVFYPFLKTTESHIGIKDLEINIMKQCKKKVNILTYCSISSDKTKNTLYDVDNEWSKADLILCNTSVTVGVNYERHNFDKVMLFASGFCNLARDIIQVSLRIRCPKSSDIDIYFYDKKCDDVYNYNNLYENKFDEVYNNLIDDVVIEKKADFMSSFYKYCDLAGFDRSNTKFYKLKSKKDINLHFNIRCGEDGEIIKAVMAYDDIDKIDEIMCKDIEIQKIYVSDATMEEKFQVSKFYFDRKYNLLDQKDRKFIWNNDLERSFKNFNHPLIRSIEEDNQNGIINIDYRNLVISDKTKEITKNTFLDINYKNDKTSIIKFINKLIGGFDLVNGNCDLVIDDKTIHLFDIFTSSCFNNEAFVDE